LIVLFIELSLEADHDLEHIYEYTLADFGTDQAVSYVLSFEDIFDKLLADPHLGRKRPEIFKGLRSIVKDDHIVFYRILEDRIRIVRILSARRDLPKMYFNYDE